MRVVRALGTRGTVGFRARVSLWCGAAASHGVRGMGLAIAAENVLACDGAHGPTRSRRRPSGIAQLPARTTNRSNQRRLRGRNVSDDTRPSVGPYANPNRRMDSSSHAGGWNPNTPTTRVRLWIRAQEFDASSVACSCSGNTILKYTAVVRCACPPFVKWTTIQTRTQVVAATPTSGRCGEGNQRSPPAAEDPTGDSTHHGRTASPYRRRARYTCEAQCHFYGQPHCIGTTAEAAAVATSSSITKRAHARARNKLRPLACDRRKLIGVAPRRARSHTK